MAPKRRVLVADDDPPILRLVRAKLQADGFVVLTATNGQEALDLFAKEQPDLLILDMMMPVLDGVETLKRLRASSATPVIFLTARAGGTDKVRSLDLGADDYITKPFDPDELSARVSAVLRRTQHEETPHEDVLDYGHVSIDLSNRRVMVDDAEVVLSKTEWDVLALLAAHPGRVMPHEELLTRIWGPEFRDETYYLRTWVSRIRKKFGEHGDGAPRITTFAGVGYRLEPPPLNE